MYDTFMYEVRWDEEGIPVLPLCDMVMRWME